MIKLVKDSQSKITRYGIKCFHLVNGFKCSAFAHAERKGNKLIISEAFNTCVDSNGKSITGIYKILSIGTGKIAEVICEKL